MKKKELKKQILMLNQEVNALEDRITELEYAFNTYKSSQSKIKPFIRASKLARELQIGIAHIDVILKTVGLGITDLRPNTRLTPEQYNTVRQYKLIDLWLKNKVEQNT